jgi:serine/threonine protein kinase
MVRKEIHYLKMSEREKQQLTQEVNILAGLRHPNIVRYYSREIAKAEGMVYLYMEYCHNGDLGSVIKHCKKTGYALFPLSTIAGDVDVELGLTDGVGNFCRKSWCGVF